MKIIGPAGGVSGSAGGTGTGGGGGGRRWLLGGMAAWAAASEACAVWEYRRMAARDAARRAELFPKWRAGERPLPPPLQDQQRRRRQEQQPEQQQQQQQRGQQQQAASLVQPQTSVSIIVPALNEEAGLEGLLRYLQGSLQPAEIIVVDGGSTDGTVAVARRCGVRVVAVGRGRARQMNAGAAVATGELLVFAHADTRPPRQLVALARAALARPAVVLGGFRPVIEYGGRPLRFFSANNTLKSYYLPALLRPLSFARGLRILFGDQTLFCRADDFRRVGGYDGRLPIMEDADLCLRLHMAGPGGQPRRRGRVVQLNSAPNRSSGRRLSSWGQAHATAVHIIIGASWWLGASPQRLVTLYRRLYTDAYR